MSGERVSAAGPPEVPSAYIVFRAWPVRGRQSDYCTQSLTIRGRVAEDWCGFISVDGGYTIAAVTFLADTEKAASVSGVALGGAFGLAW